MAISTYAELLTALANYTHRDDLTNRIPEFIQMGEADLNARLRTNDQEETESSSLSTSVNTLALPAGYLESTRLEYTSDLSEIVCVPSSMLDASTDSGQPYRYTIRDGNIVFELTPDSAYTVKHYYRKKYDIATDLTNWVLTNHPNLYLYSAMMHASLYAMDDSRAMFFSNYLYGPDGKSGEVAAVNRAESRKRTGNTLMLNDLPHTYRSSSILNG